MDRAGRGQARTAAAALDEAAEWLEADGLGGFASGTATGVPTRRYHGWLVVAQQPPVDRIMLVNGVDAWVDDPSGRISLSSYQWASGAIVPGGAMRLIGFTTELWPTWTFQLPDGRSLRQELFVPHGASTVTSCWTVDTGDQPVHLRVRPLLSGRSIHALLQEHAVPVGLRLTGRTIEWTLPNAPPVRLLTNGVYSHDPDWYRGFCYREERARGFDSVEDLVTPGVVSWDLSAGPAVMIMETGRSTTRATADPMRTYRRLQTAALEHRQTFDTPLLRAGAAYVVKRGTGRSIIAGYPWFGDWGRDTFISMRGLCLATGRLKEAGDILAAWAETVDRGMLPNRFPDHGGEPEYNSVDASLWFAIAAAEYLDLMARAGGLGKRAESRLIRAVHAIITGYRTGTRYGIRLDGDGLIACGTPGVQLTWMDAKVGDRVITPRIGKPVEIQALWLNVMALFRDRFDECPALLSAGLAAFAERFVDRERGVLFDVVDEDHQSGKVDRRCRPNQIFAVGGLPLTLLDAKMARRVVEAVEASLWTAMGLRSLAPEEPGYAAHYVGGPGERDERYHQGTVWPWLVGPFAEAWTKAHGWTRRSRATARTRFLAPLMTHLHVAGVGHVSELADADHPHTPRGAPFQAWSMAELLRLDGLLNQPRPAPLFLPDTTAAAPMNRKAVAPLRSVNT